MIYEEPDRNIGFFFFTAETQSAQRVIHIKPLTR